MLNDNPLIFTRNIDEILDLLRDDPSACYERVDSLVIKHVLEMSGAWWKYKPRSSVFHPEIRGFHASQFVCFSQAVKYPLLKSFFAKLLAENIAKALSCYPHQSISRHVISCLDLPAEMIAPSVVDCLREKNLQSYPVRISSQNGSSLRSDIGCDEMVIYIRSIIVPEFLGIDTLLLYSGKNKSMLAAVVDRRPGNAVQGVVSLVRDSSFEAYNVGLGDICPLCLESKPLNMVDVHSDPLVWSQLIANS